VLSKASLRTQLHVGAANFGSNYGISSKELLTKGEIHKILNYAARNGMVVDSAADYPNSHQLIGCNKGKLRVATKIDSRSYKNFKELSAAVNNARELLNQDTIEILYLRSSKFLFAEEEKAKIKNLIEHSASLGILEIGFSIYEESELDLIENVFGYNFTFQVPYSLANVSFKRVIENHKNKSLNSKFVARSIFLQGLLTLPIHEIPEKLSPILPLREWVTAKSEINGCSEMDLCLRFVANSNLFEAIVVGVQSLDQLEECKTSLDDLTNSRLIELGDPPPVPRIISDPRNWNSI